MLQDVSVLQIDIILEDTLSRERSQRKKENISLNLEGPISLKAENVLCNPPILIILPKKFKMKSTECLLEKT